MRRGPQGPQGRQQAGGKAWRKLLELAKENRNCQGLSISRKNGSGTAGSLQADGVKALVVRDSKRMHHATLAGHGFAVLLFSEHIPSAAARFNSQRGLLNEWKRLACMCARVCVCVSVCRGLSDKVGYLHAPAPSPRRPAAWREHLQRNARRPSAFRECYGAHRRALAA